MVGQHMNVPINLSMESTQKMIIAKGTNPGWTESHQLEVISLLTIPEHVSSALLHLTTLALQSNCFKTRLSMLMGSTFCANLSSTNREHD